MPTMPRACGAVGRTVSFPDSLAARVSTPRSLTSFHQVLPASAGAAGTRAGLQSESRL